MNFAEDNCIMTDLEILKFYSIATNRDLTNEFLEQFQKQVNIEYVLINLFL